MNIHITLEDYKIIREALMELPAKKSMDLIINMDQQVLEQNKVQRATTEEK